MYVYTYHTNSKSHQNVNKHYVWSIYWISITSKSTQRHYAYLPSYACKLLNHYSNYITIGDQFFNNYYSGGYITYPCNVYLKIMRFMVTGAELAVSTFIPQLLKFLNDVLHIYMIYSLVLRLQLFYQYFILSSSHSSVICSNAYYILLFFTLVYVFITACLPTHKCIQNNVF